MAEITKQTVFAKIHKLDPRVHGPVADKPYAVMTMDYSATRSYGNKSRWGTDCATLDEARAFVAEKGWVLVKSWKEAKEFTKELRTADSAARQAVEDARKGKRLIRVDNAGGRHVLRLHRCRVGRRIDHRPSSAATTKITISVALAPRARMAVNASWPGVSRKVITPRGVSTW
jgi:hypothetical protein